MTHHNRGHAIENNTASAPVIEIERFNLFLGERHVLKNINFCIPEGKVTTIIGPSGCGKSTLLRCLNRMNDLIPEVRIEGSIRIKSHEITSSGADLIQLRRQVGMIFNKAVIFPRSIYENLVYGLRVSGIKNKDRLRRIAEQSLTRTGLWLELQDRLSEPALNLPEGLKQRLCIARALTVKPDVLLMDEPCSELDPIATGRLEDLIDDLKQDYTIIMVTHNLQQAARISEFTACMFDGELIEFNTTNKIFTMPRQQKTQDYITGRIG